MGNWQDSAKQSVINRASGGVKSHKATVGAKSSDSWQQQAKQSLDSRGYIAPENRMYEIKTNNGKNFGTVSYGAYKAIQNNTLDKYSPKNDNEKNVINAFKSYLSEQVKAQEKAEKQKRINSNPVTKKYGIDPDDFTQVDFEKWAEEHGFEYRMGGNDLTGAEMKWMPKQKKGWRFWEVVPSKEEQSDKKTLETLAENNGRKAASQTDKGAIAAVVVNAIDGLTFGAVNAYADWEAKRDYKKAGLDEDSFVSYKQAKTKTESEHKIASAAGNIAGSLVSLGGLSKAVGTAASGVKWIAKTPGWVQSAINSGITFAVQSGAKTAFDGGNFEDVLKSAGINLVGGAVGGGVSSKVGSIGEKLLFDKGLQHKVIPEMIRTGISSATFAGSKTASTYFLYPEDYRPTKEEMAKDITTAFAFGAISSGINTLKTSSQNKRYLDGLYQRMAADYESMAKANISSENDMSGIQRFAKNVVGYSNAMEAYLTGKEYNATIDGNTYKFTPNKIRMVGQNKYVEAMLDEINTIRNNANAVLNGIGTPNASIAETSAPANNANTPAAAAPTSKTISASGNIPVSPASDTTGVTSAAAAEEISTQNSPIVNTAVSETAVKTNTGGELGKAMSRVSITAFAPETASSEIKRLENILVAKGADDKSRQEAITAALEVEKALTGSNKDIRSVFKDVSKITSDAVAEIKSKVGASGAYWKLFGENFKAIPSENTNESINLVIEYANAYTEALKENNPEKYNSVIVSADGTDLSAELPQTIMQNIIPASVKNVGAYRLAAAQIKNIVKNVDLQISNERAEIYGAETENTPVSVGDAFKDTKTGNTITVLERDAENTAVEIDTGTKIETRKISNNQADSLVTSEQFEQIENTETTPQNITLTKMGDFYEAYGNEAVELANKLNLNLTTKTVNGKRVQMVGFPVSSLERYTQALGSGYNISVSDTASVTTQMTQNTPVHTENTVVNEDTTDTGIINHAKEVDGLKLIDTEESTLINGKTLITGVYELNSDKDFDRKSYRKEKLDYFRKAGNPWTETVNGTTYGHYGFYKYKDGRYLVMHLPTGMGITDTKTESKAKSLIKALDDNLPELPLNIKAFGDEYRCSGMTQEISVSIKSVINSADEPVVKEIQDGKVPFSTKAGLVDYVKTHIGDKVRVTFDNGVSEVRTLESISNASMRTKKPDGSDSFTDLKGIKYSDNGFSIDFGTGVSVAYDFINTTEMPESVTEPAERLTENTDSVTEMPENESAVPYTDKEKRNWKNSNTIIVYESDEQFENFVEKVLNNEDTHKKIYFGKIPAATAQMVLDKTGVDVSEHNIALKGYEIRKILINSHGDEEAEATRGQEPITTDDLKNIPSIITNPDDVNLSDKKYEGKPALLFEKTIDGKNYVVAYVSKKHHDIAIQTMYKKRSLATAENANALSSTPETTSSTASNNSVSQDIGIVNNSVRNNAESASDNVSEEKIEIETKMFNDIVDEVEDDDTVSGKKGKHYYVSKHTPEIIVKKADIKDLPMIISFEALYLAVRENGELKGHYHGLGASNTKKLYKVLSAPAYILKNKENGRINIISEIAIGKNNKSVISIELDVYKNVEGGKDTKHKGNYNLVITLFSAKDNYVENLKNKQEMSVLYEKKEDTHSSDLTSENMMLGNTENVSSNNIIAQGNDAVNNSVRNNVENDTSEVYNIAFFEKLNSALRKGESIPLKDVRTAVETLLTNNGEIIKTELSKLKKDELKKRISIYDRGRATKKAEMVESIYTNMLSNLYYTLSGKDTITYIYDGNSFDTQQSKMLLDLLRKLTDETFGERLAENAEKYKKQLAVREEKITRVKNPQSLEDFAYKKKYFGLSDEETIHYEKLYAEERRKARNKKKVPSLAESIKEADSFFANADNYTIEKTSHTKTGEDVWVVRPAGRLEIGRWKQLNEQMKTLGGSYWRGNQGWNFKKDPTAVLNSTKETEAIKDSAGAEKLRAVAEGMQKAIDDKFKNRLTNTAKRAREAAAAEAEGERLKMLQGTINNIAATIENGGDTLLDKIDSKAQVETLMGMLRTSRRNRIGDTMSDVSYNERLKEHEKPYSDNDVKYAEYPLTKLHENIVNEYIHSAEGKTGYKQITERLKKSLKYVKNGYIIVNSQIFSDIDKIVKNLSTIRADYWNEGVLERKRLARMGIENVVELRAYLREFIDFLPGKDVDAERQRNIKSKERELTNAKIDGFFPTPKTIVEDMLDEADIQPGEKVLEPSAGKGNIADVIRETYPDNTLDVVELNASLNELLSEKGYNVVGNNFLKTSGKYDKIIMNPPFEKGQDIDHIKHAYSLLNDGGRVVCIMSEGTFYRSDKKAVAFREWLENVGGISEKLPDGAFKNAERSTGVNTRMVIIDKVAEYAPKVENTIGRSDKSVHSSRDLSAKSNSNRGSSDVEEIKIEPLARSSGKNPVNSVNAISSFDNSSISQSEDVGNRQPMQEPEKDSQPQQGKSYTYKALTQKSDMKVTLLDSHNIYDETGKMDRHLLLDKAMENVKSKNNPKNTAEKNFVYVPDIERDVLVGRKGLSHGLSRNANITALVTTKIGDIVENSIKVNELKPRNNTAGGYVLLGIAKDNKNNYYPVRIIVNNYAVDNVEILDVLYAVNAKKKGQFSNETELPANAVPPIKDPSTISVADLIEAVKDNFSDVLTDDVLNNVGAKRRKSSLSGSMVYKDVANDDTSRWSTERVEGNKNSNVNIADIVKIIRDKFDIPISTGKVTDNKASGIYKEKPEIIRTRIANNLPTISHELGHHLDKKYDLSKLESVKELRKVVSEEFLKQYPANAKNSEAVAEFVRVYLKNTNEANRLCPEFYSDFIGTLSKEDLKAVNEIASSVNEYMSYNISERYDAAIVSSQKRERVPFGDKWHKWYSDWVDSFHPQKQVVDYVEDITGKSLSGKNNAYVLATNSLNAHTIANFLICEGFRDLDGNIIDAKSFVDSIGMVDSKNVKLLDKYLVLRHSLEWIAPEQEDVKVKRVFADDTLENVEEIKKQIAEIEKTHLEIKTAAENLYEYQNNVLEHFVISAGGMTDDTLRELNRMYPSYVPFYRAKGKKTGLAKGTFANQRSPIMRAKGSGELIISPTESIIRNTEKMVKYALRNQVMQELANYADNVDGFGQFMEKVPPDMIPHTVNIRGMKESFTDALQQVVNSGEDYFAVSDLFEELFGDTVTDFTPVANANKRIVTVMKGGKPSYYQIHNEEFYKSVAELAPQQVNGLLKISQTVMQPMKLLITQNNPVFAVTNAIRDYGTAYKLSEIKNPAVFAQKYIQALGGIISNGDAYKQYKAMGGGHSSELSANIGNISKTLRDVAQKDMGKARRLAYSVFRHPVETVASLNDVIESTPRFMEFQRTLESGGDLQQAIYNADDITTNFKKSGKGAMAKSVNKLVMFNNAAIQGLDKLFRTITDKDSKKRYKTLLKWLLNALIMGVIGWLWNKEVDEEGYKNLSSYKKNNFYNFAIGDGKFISLPKPRENALLDTFTERTIEYLAGENKDAFYDFGNYLTSQLLPPMLPDTLNPVDATHSVLGGTVLGGLADVGFNRDFKGTPIEGEYDKYNPNNERYTESTTKLAYGLGQTKLARDLDMSPKKIDHLISSYTGILGQVNKAVFPMNDSSRDTSLGLRNKFISDSNYSTDVLNRMYENQEKAERAFNYSGSVDDAVEYENNSIITSYISGMNKAIKALPEEEQRNGRTYLLKSLNSWNYEDTASQLNMLSNLDGQTIDRNAIFDTLPSSTLEWTVDKQKYVYQMTPQEYHKYISNYLAIIENARKHYGRNTVESYEAAKTAANKYMSEYKKNVLKGQYLSKATAKTE